MSFFFNDTATTEIYTLSLHDALPISDMTYGHRNDPEGFHRSLREFDDAVPAILEALRPDDLLVLCSEDRKSTRLNSSHANISYAVFCLKKKRLLEDCMFWIGETSLFN